MSKIIAAILTKNEARHIGDCIKSVQWVDEVILEDSFSDDDTTAIARNLNAHIFKSEVFSALKQPSLVYPTPLPGVIIKHYRSTPKPSTEALNSLQIINSV